MKGVFQNLHFFDSEMQTILLVFFTHIIVTIEQYFQFYNTVRRHQALNRQTPDEVYLVGPDKAEAA